MKLLVLNWQDRLNPEAGGAETHLHEIFGRLAGFGHDVTLLVSSWRGAAPRETLDGMTVHRTGGRYTFSLAAPGYYRRHLARERFDVVIEDLNKVPIFSPLWSAGPHVLLVHHLFGTAAFAEASPPLAAATWLLEKPIPRVYRALPVEAVSESTANELAARGFDRSRIVVIPNGVEMSGTPREEARFLAPTVLYLGRLKRYKRVDLVLRAIARLRERGLDVRGVIAGSGDYATELHELRGELGLSDVVEMPGFVSDAEKRRLFAGAWVHVLTSIKEGWGITNIEAAAAGTPTVASDSPGLRDSVLDGRTGYLVPHADLDALCDRLDAILRNPAERDRLGAGAREFAQQFTWERAAHATQAHLERVRAGGRSES